MTRTAKKKPVGTVTFVGAGPGDPELLTLRAVERLHDEEVVERFDRHFELRGNGVQHRS